MTRPVIEPSSPEPLANTLTIIPMYTLKIIISSYHETHTHTHTECPEIERKEKEKKCVDEISKQLSKRNCKERCQEKGCTLEFSEDSSTYSVGWDKEREKPQNIKKKKISFFLTPKKNDD